MFRSPYHAISGSAVPAEADWVRGERLTIKKSEPRIRSASDRGAWAFAWYILSVRAKLDVGRTYSRQSRVEEWMTAEKAGNKGVDALSTPMLVQLIEDAAMACVGPTLEENQVTLATSIDLEHKRPVPVGFILRTEVEVVLVDGPRINFTVRVFDEQEAVAEGTHERYVMDRAKFRSKLEEKLT